MLELSAIEEDIRNYNSNIMYKYSSYVKVHVGNSGMKKSSSLFRVIFVSEAGF